ncbi:hypothetical protein ABEH87_03695 [Erwinia sp. Eh17-17]|uniref:anti-sigma factor family protein n=1 Tax=Erwinia sp. Eh17-17 TaxID=3080330 RepID=UPI003209262D
MSTQRFSAPYSDEAIVAWLDGEMTTEEHQSFEQRLKRDQALAARTAEMMKTNQPFAEAFDAMLDSAPTARMQDNLEELLAKTPQAAPHGQVSRRALIAASLSFLLIGSGLGYVARPDHARRESEKIRDLESQYMSLYSPQTLVDVDSSAALIERSLARTAGQMGLHLSQQQLMLQDAELKSIRLLRYDDTHIVQIAWQHQQYGPVALCVSDESHENSTPVEAEQRHGMNVAWWHAGGYQFVLIGRSPAARLVESAGRLRQGLRAV